VVWFLYIVCYSYFPLWFSLELFQIFNGVVANAGYYWLMMLLVPVACLLPGFFVRQAYTMLAPEDHQIILEHERGRGLLSGVDPETYAAYKMQKKLKKAGSQNRGAERRLC
jgi:hypothetical protein